MKNTAAMISVITIERRSSMSVMPPSERMRGRNLSTWRRPVDRFRPLIRSEGGMTLIELLLSMVITLIIAAVFFIPLVYVHLGYPSSRAPTHDNGHSRLAVVSH